MRHRPSLFALLALLAAAGASASNLPLKINFSGKLLDPVTSEPRNGPLTMTFRLYGALSGGGALYTETQNSVPVTNGVFSVQIGSVTGLTTDLFHGASAYLSVQVSGDSEMSPRQQLTMAAYAFTAAQLVSDGPASVRVGNAYSTFTAAGDLHLPGGVSASSGMFVNGVTASSGTFSATGSGQYSVQTASGALVGGGTLRAAGAGGVEATYGVKAATFTGEGADLTEVRVKYSSHAAFNTFNAVTATEVLLSSAVITPARTTSRFLVLASANLNRAANAVGNWTLRLRRNAGAACTTASTSVHAASAFVPNVNPYSGLQHMSFVDDPATTSDVWYCLTAFQSSGVTHTVSTRTLILTELAP